MTFDFKDLKDLSTCSMVPLMAPKLKPYAQYIYWGLTGVLAVLFLCSFTTLPNIAIFLLSWVLIAAAFVLLRMVCEFLTDYQTVNYRPAKKAAPEMETKEETK